MEWQVVWGFSSTGSVAGILSSHDTKEEAEAEAEAAAAEADDNPAYAYWVVENDNDSPPW